MTEGKPGAKTSAEKTSFWRAHIRAWARSGLSIKEYCRRQNISHHAFGYWKKKLLKNGGGEAAGVTAIEVARVNCGTGNGYEMRVRLRSGHEIEVRRGFSGDDLSRLIQVVEGI